MNRTRAIVSPEAMAGWWGSEPATIIRGTADGFAACEWQLCWPRPSEIYAEADASTHILSIHLDGTATTSHEHDGRLFYNGLIRPNSIIIVPAGVRPRAVIQSDGLSFFHVYISHERLKRLAEEIGVRPDNVEILPRSYEIDETLAALCRCLADEGRAGPASRLFTDSIATVLTGHLLRRHTSHEPSVRPSYRKGMLSPWQLTRITAKLADEIDRNVGLDELARLVDLSPTYLCSSFRRSTGMPPHQWQKQLRIDRAKALLEEDRLSVTEIALEVGYANPGHFATLFKGATGLSPRAWRWQHKR